MTDLVLKLLAAGYQARRQGQAQEALTAFSQAATESREASNDPLLAEALTAIGYTERDMKNISSALDHYRAAAEAYRHLDEPLRLAHTIRHIADMLREEARLGESNREYEEALAIYRGCQDVPPLDLANALRGFALLKESLGEVAAARAMWQEAGKLYEIAGVEAGVDESRRRVLLPGNESKVNPVGG